MVQIKATLGLRTDWFTVSARGTYGGQTQPRSACLLDTKEPTTASLSALLLARRRTSFSGIRTACMLLVGFGCYVPTHVPLSLLTQSLLK